MALSLFESHLEGVRYYAYRVDGPWNPDEGYRFDASKALLDPYAKGVVFHDRFERPTSAEEVDSAGRAPLACLGGSRASFGWSGDCQVDHGSDLIIYEMHVRGFTKHASSGLAAARCGTFQGVIDKIPYLQQLGVTAVELMPIFSA